MLGEHACELDAAQRGRAHHPEAISAVLYESRARAAVGNLEAVSRCIDEACAFPRDRFADAGDVMLDTARELRAHGRVAEGKELTHRAIGWYTDQHQRQGGRADPRDSRLLARAYYEGGQWDDAAARCESSPPSRRTTST